MYYSRKTEKSSLSLPGFTLIELLVVLGIISLLASILLASINRARLQARDARRVEDLNQIRNALETYVNDHGSYPIGGWLYSVNSSWNDLQIALAPYLPTLPKDPLNNGGSGPWSTGQYGYAYNSNGTKYDLVTQFEDAANSNRCEVKCWREHVNANETPWCSVCPGGQNYSPYMYADH